MGMKSELREVLVNMVFNAWMPCGRWSLTLGAFDIDDSVVIMIADTGSGMLLRSNRALLIHSLQRRAKREWFGLHELRNIRRQKARYR